MSEPELAEIVDLARYPVDRLESPAGRALVARCRAALERDALCALPDFVRPAALAVMVAEAEHLAPRAYRYDRRPDQVFEQSYIEELRSVRAAAKSLAVSSSSP